jgi:signal recognition particle GTPase
VFLTLLQSRSAPPPPPPTPVIDGGGSSAKRSRKGWGRERQIYEASLRSELDSKTSSIAELEQIRQALAKHTESQRLARKLVNYDGDLEELASLQKELAKLQVTYKNKAEQSKELQEASAALRSFLLDEEDTITALMAMQEFEARQILAVLGINIH